MANDALSIGQLAEATGLSRSTLLYYDRLGLLPPADRTASNYRLYGKADLARVRQIGTYRQMGIPLREIGELLSGAGEARSAQILRQRLENLGREIDTLRQQQRCVVALLRQKDLQEQDDMVTKKRWIEIMQAAGLKDDDMHNWHIQFEKMEPDAHQEFLESLGIQSSEIERIRDRSRRGSS